MKETIKYLTMLLMVLACGMITSCGGDDSDDGGSGGGSGTDTPSENVLLGTWRDTDGSWWETFTFNSNYKGTFTYHSRDGRRESVSFDYSYSSYDSKNSSGVVVMKWTSSGKMTYMKAGTSESRGFRVVDKNLYWSSEWGDTPYIKQK